QRADRGGAPHGPRRRRGHRQATAAARTRGHAAAGESRFRAHRGPAATRRAHHRRHRRRRDQEVGMTAESAMYTLYGRHGPGSASTEAGLTLVGAPWRMVETASWEPNAAFQALLEVNPLGQIPTLVLPDGSVLSESAAILIHLADAHPASGLLPRE